MPHQQKLRHIADYTNVAAANAVVINHGLLLDADNHPSLAVVPLMLDHFFYGADPSATSRLWWTAIGAANATLNWAGVTNLGGTNIRVMIYIPHSICMDYSSQEKMY